jgi:hypothetical protein
MHLPAGFHLSEPPSTVVVDESFGMLHADPSPPSIDLMMVLQVYYYRATLLSCHNISYLNSKGIGFFLLIYRQVDL